MQVATYLDDAHLNITPPVGTEGPRTFSEINVLRSQMNVIQNHWFVATNLCWRLVVEIVLLRYRSRVTMERNTSESVPVFFHLGVDCQPSAPENELLTSSTG